MKKKDLKKASQDTMDKFFSGAQTDIVSEKKVKTVTKRGKKTETHKPFSFWAEKSEADDWRIWAKAKGMKVDDLGSQAIREYIKRHGLSEDQKKLYELMKR